MMTIGGATRFLTARINTSGTKQISETIKAGLTLGPEMKHKKSISKYCHSNIDSDRWGRLFFFWDVGILYHWYVAWTFFKKKKKEEKLSSSTTMPMYSDETTKKYHKPLVDSVFDVVVLCKHRVIWSCFLWVICLHSNLASVPFPSWVFIMIGLVSL